MAWQKLPIQVGDNIQDADRFQEIVDAVNERAHAVAAVHGGTPSTISLPEHVQKRNWWYSVQNWIETHIGFFVVNHDQYGNRITPEDYDGAVDDAEWQGNTTYTFPKWTLQQMFQSMGITGWTRMPRGGSPTTGKAQVRDYVTADLFNEIMKALDRMEVMELENPVWYHWNEEDEEWVQGLYVFGPPQMYYYEQYYGPESGWKSSLAEAKAQAEGAWESVPGASYPGPSIFQRWAGLSKRIYPYPPEDPDNPVYQWIGTAGHVAPSAEATVGLGVVLNNRPSGGTVYIYWSGRATTEPTWDENSVFDNAGYPIREDSLTLLESDSFSSGGPQTFVVEITMGESPPSFPTWPNEPPDPTDAKVTTSAAGWMERSRMAAGFRCARGGRLMCVSGNLICAVRLHGYNRLQRRA